jgi:hypothetical protein
MVKMSKFIQNLVKPKVNKDAFWCKEKKTGQGCDKKMYPKLVVNKLKVMGNFTFISIDWALSSRKFSKKLPTYMWPMFTHVRS